ncbi:unnamed protein product [Lasius platythorax]|uniref:Uncharacterized protein n=2 Tax=Lasius TaxID=488720 RepID=A0A0J7K9M3_LASNI|nr:hypothetical protein RF55_13804 [Lasius niger]
MLHNYEETKRKECLEQQENTVSVENTGSAGNTESIKENIERRISPTEDLFKLNMLMKNVVCNRNAYEIPEVFHYNKKAKRKEYQVQHKNTVSVGNTGGAENTKSIRENIKRKISPTEDLFKLNMLMKNVVCNRNASYETPKVFHYNGKAKRKECQVQHKNTTSVENTGGTENTESIGKNIKRKISPTENLYKLNMLVKNALCNRNASDETPEVLNHYAKTEEECQEQQEINKTTGESTERENAPMGILKIMHDVMEKRVLPNDLTEYLNSYERVKEIECQVQQENNISSGEITERKNTSEIFLKMMNNATTEEYVSPENLTKYLNSYGKAEGKEHEK